MRQLPVFVHAEPAGTLTQERDGGCVFTYQAPAPAGFVSLTMPVRASSYLHRRLFPLFEMHLPEGYLLAVIKKHVGKLGVDDDVALLALLAPDLKGRVTLHAQAHRDDASLTLPELLQGSSPALFDDLVRRFALRSPLSGVQPKVLAPLLDKATLTVDDVIVKAWGPDYPHLALNEWLCMRCLQQAQVEVPEFYLSDDERLFVLRRFDRRPDGGYWGFEDFCVLQARSRDEKYSGSYEQLAKSIRQFTAPTWRQPAMQTFFKAMVLNQCLQNGDAHLKNFGVLYSSLDDVRLAPVYDVVSTTAYLRHDMQALTLQGTKRFLPLERMRHFGTAVCGLTGRQVQESIDACLEGLRWLLTATAERLASPGDPAREALLRHLHRLASQALQRPSRSS